MENFIYSLFNNSAIKVLAIFIILDTIMGILRAIKYRKINSAIGIDGMIRKAGMVLSIFFFYLVDFVIKIDLIGFIPEETKTLLNINKIGMGDLFSLIFITFEFLSVLKNMTLCKLPIPKKLQNFLNKLLKEFTQEIKEGEKNEKGN